MSTSLHIHRHVLRGRSTDQWSAALPDTVANGLVDALQAASPVGRGGVWLIRRLDVRTAVAAGSGARVVVDQLAAALVRELEQTLAAGARDSDVRWYPDRAAFLAQWLVDVRAGRAAQRWEYCAFAADSATAAIRLRAEAEPDDLLLAMRQLRAADMDEVVGSLAPADATAIVHLLARGRDTADVAGLAATAACLAAAGRLPRDPRCATLLVLLAYGDSAGPGDAALARDVTSLVLESLACPAGDRAAMLVAWRDGDWTTAARLGCTTAVSTLAGWPAATRAAAVDSLQQASLATRDPAGERGYTRIGGQFLLLPLLAELPLAAATSGWPACDEQPPASALAALAVVGILGAEQVLADPYFQLATGGPPVTLAELAHWTDAVGASRLDSLRSAFAEVVARRVEGVRFDLADPELLIPGFSTPAADAVRIVSSALVRELAYRLPGMPTASVAYLRRNVLACDAHVTIDDERIIVELGPPPLSLLLALTGMNRRRYCLPATGDRPWVITAHR